jgi:hypothetical protein
MSEDRTKKLDEPNSSEARFDRMEIRITKLEERQHDTKPIWERALAEIAEARLESRTNNEVLRTEMKAGIEDLRTEMKAEFAAVRHEIEHGLRGVARTIDTLNHNVLEMQTYQRYLDRRLEELETQTKPA